MIKTDADTVIRDDACASDSLHPLEIRLFGQQQTLVYGNPIPSLRSQRGHLLLALLTLRSAGPYLPRSYYAGLLWPESEEEKALASLRRTLTDLRRALGSEASRIYAPTPRMLALDLSGAFADVIAFDHLAGTRNDVESQRESITLYRDDLLQGCLEDWVLQERQSRQEIFLQRVEAFAEAVLAKNADFSSLLTLLRRAVSLNPWRETTQRLLFRTLAASGDQAGVTLAYREFRLALRREMNTQPDTETVTLYNGLRQNVTSEATQARVTASDKLLLPPTLTSLIGRERETKEIFSALTEARLVTLSGAGGVGKTRLALHVADQAQTAFPDGVCFVDLAPIRDPDQVPIAVARNLALRETPGVSFTEALLLHLSPLRFMLVLDNCEHLGDTCSILATEILKRCPGIRILATSRHTLAAQGEIVCRVPPLAVPAKTSALTLEDLLEFEAVHLFVVRARESQSAFALTTTNAKTVVTICQGLDGIPLAIELAAPLVRVLSVEQIAARLDDRFRLLSGSRILGRPAHQETLQAVMDWSYQLLSREEQILLRRLAIFANGCTLEAAHVVCGEGDQDDWTILDLITILQDKSLIQREELDKIPEIRYRLLETVREYGLKCLQYSGEWDRIADRQTSYFREWAARIGPELGKAQQTLYLDQVERELDNLRAVLDRVDNEIRLEIAGTLHRYWQRRGHFREGRDYLDSALAAQNPPIRDAKRARALNGAGVIAFHQEDYDVARRYQREAISIYEEIEDDRGLASSTNNLAMTAFGENKLAESRALYQRALEINRRTGNRAWQGINLNNLSLIAGREGDYALATRFLEQALAIHRELQNFADTAATLNNMALNFYRQEDYPRAIPLLEQAITLNRQTGNRSWEAVNYRNLGRCALEMKRPGRAEECGRLCLALWQELGQSQLVAQAIDLVATAIYQQGQPRTAARLWGAAVALVDNDPEGLKIDPTLKPLYERFAPSARASLGDEIYETAFWEGKIAPSTQIIAELIRESAPVPKLQGAGDRRIA